MDKVAPWPFSLTEASVTIQSWSELIEEVGLFDGSVGTSEIS